MKKLQVLVATMKQDDSAALVEKMNIKCDAVIANQHDRYTVDIKHTEYGEIKTVTTNTRGVGLNRNLAIMYSDAEILLFADDDIRYYDGELEGVKAAFDSLPDADVIIFGLDFTKNNEVIEKRHLPVKRRNLRNGLKYGACALAVRRKSILRTNITFHQSFGGGCIYSSGEDSLFIIECLKKGLRVYTHNYVLGACKKDQSSWFKGFNEKYFFDRGVFFSYAFPNVKYLVSIFFGIKMKLRGKTQLSLLKTVSYMLKGARVGKKLISYEEYVGINGK